MLRVAGCMSGWLDELLLWKKFVVVIIFMLTLRFAAGMNVLYELHHSLLLTTWAILFKLLARALLLRHSCSIKAKATLTVLCRVCWFQAKTCKHTRRLPMLCACAVSWPQGIGMNVVAYDLRPNPAVEAMGIPYVSIEEMLPIADVVSLHVPMLPSTYHIINRPRQVLLHLTAQISQH